MAHTTVTTQRGRTFAVRIVRQGDRYGLGMQLVHDEPFSLVEFYDYNQAGHAAWCKAGWGEYGQFVSRYRAKDMLTRTPGTGLALHLGAPEWSLDGAAMGEVTAWLHATL